MPPRTKLPAANCAPAPALPSFVLPDTGYVRMPVVAGVTVPNSSGSDEP